MRTILQAAVGLAETSPAWMASGNQRSSHVLPSRSHAELRHLTSFVEPRVGGNRTPPLGHLRIPSLCGSAAAQSKKFGAKALAFNSPLLCLSEVSPKKLHQFLFWYTPELLEFGSHHLADTPQ